MDDDGSSSSGEGVPPNFPSFCGYSAPTAEGVPLFVPAWNVGSPQVTATPSDTHQCVRPRVHGRDSEESHPLLDDPPVPVETPPMLTPPLFTPRGRGRDNVTPSVDPYAHRDEDVAATLDDNSSLDGSKDTPTHYIRAARQSQYGNDSSSYLLCMGLGSASLEIKDLLASLQQVDPKQKTKKVIRMMKPDLVAEVPRSYAPISSFRIIDVVSASGFALRNLAAARAETVAGGRRRRQWRI
jgi:hypothetical protein